MGWKRGSSCNHGSKKEGVTFNAIIVIKEKTHTLHGDSWQHSPRKDSTNWRPQLVKTQIHSKGVSLNSECQWSNFLLEKSLGKCLPQGQDTEAITTVVHGHRLHLKLPLKFGNISCVVPILQIWKMYEGGIHGGLCQGSRKHLRSGNMRHGQIPWKKTLRGHCMKLG